jgi:hypothetical protein
MARPCDRGNEQKYFVTAQEIIRSAVAFFGKRKLSAALLNFVSNKNTIVVSAPI